MDKMRKVKKNVYRAVAPFVITAFLIGGSWSAYAKETKGKPGISNKPPAVETIQNKQDDKNQVVDENEVMKDGEKDKQTQKKDTPPTSNMSHCFSLDGDSFTLSIEKDGSEYKLMGKLSDLLGAKDVGKYAENLYKNIGNNLSDDEKDAIVVELNKIKRDAQDKVDEEYSWKLKVKGVKFVKNKENNDRYDIYLVFEGISGPVFTGVYATKAEVMDLKKALSGEEGKKNLKLLDESISETINKMINSNDSKIKPSPWGVKKIVFQAQKDAIELMKKESDSKNLKLSAEKGKSEIVIKSEENKKLKAKRKMAKLPEVELDDDGNYTAKVLPGNGPSHLALALVMKYDKDNNLYLSKKDRKKAMMTLMNKIIEKINNREGVENIELYNGNKIKKAGGTITLSSDEVKDALSNAKVSVEPKVSLEDEQWTLRVDKEDNAYKLSKILLKEYQENNNENLSKVYAKRALKGLKQLVAQKLKDKNAEDNQISLSSEEVNKVVEDAKNIIYTVKADAKKGLSGISHMVRYAVEKWLKDSGKDIRPSEVDYLASTISDSISGKVVEALGDKDKGTVEINEDGLKVKVDVYKLSENLKIYDQESNEEKDYSITSAAPFIKKGSEISLSTKYIEGKYNAITDQESEDSLSTEDVYTYNFKATIKGISKLVDRAINLFLERDKNADEPLNPTKKELKELKKELVKDIQKAIDDAKKGLKDVENELVYVYAPVNDDLSLVYVSPKKNKPEYKNVWRDAFLRFSNIYDVMAGMLEKIRNKQEQNVKQVKEEPDQTNNNEGVTSEEFNQEESQKEGQQAQDANDVNQDQGDADTIQTNDDEQEVQAGTQQGQDNVQDQENNIVEVNPPEGSMPASGETAVPADKSDSGKPVQVPGPSEVDKDTYEETLKKQMKEKKQ